MNVGTMGLTFTLVLACAAGACSVSTDSNGRIGRRMDLRPKVFALAQTDEDRKVLMDWENLIGFPPEHAAPAEEMRAAHQEESCKPRFHFMTDADLECMGPVEMLVDGLAESKAVGLMFGSFGVLKSFLAVELAFCIQLNRDFFGRGVLQGDVYYVAGEGRSGYPARIRAWKEANSAPGVAGVNFLLESINLLDASAVRQFVTDVQRNGEKVALVIFDTLSQCTPGGREDNETHNIAYHSARHISQALSCAVLLVHHSPLEGDRPRGGTVLESNVDWAWQLKRQGPQVTVSCFKPKNFEAFEDFTIELKRVGESAALVTAIDDVAVNRQLCSDSMLRALRSLQDGSTAEGLSTSNWLKVTEMKERTFYLARKRLLEAGYVDTVKSRNVITVEGQTQL